jgi:hypothetical protein
MVLRATAVASHTPLTPPRPAVSASLAATSRRPQRRDGLKAQRDGGDIDHRLKILTPPLPEYLYLDRFIAFSP